MGPVQDRKVAESAPTRLSFGVIFFFFYINLITVHKKNFFTPTHTQIKEQNDKGLMSNKRNNNKGNDQRRAIVYRAP